VVTETPHNLADVLPCIQVSRFGGADEYVSSFDNPSMDFDCYAASRIEARQLAYDVRSSLRDDLPGEVVAGASIVRVRTISGPRGPRTTTPTCAGSPTPRRSDSAASRRRHGRHQDDHPVPPHVRRHRRRGALPRDVDAWVEQGWRKTKPKTDSE
jgi:hypothetical protein